MLGCDITVQDKLSPLYLYSSRFIVPKKALYQWYQCFPSISGESSMKKNEHQHKPPLCSSLFYSDLSTLLSSHSLLPSSFHLLFTQPSHHSRIHSSSGHRKRLVGSIAGQGGVLLGGVLLLRYGEGQEVLCIWVVKQNNKPSSCQVK